MYVAHAIGAIKYTCRYRYIGMPTFLLESVLDRNEENTAFKHIELR